MSGQLIGPIGVLPTAGGGGSFTPASLSNLIGWYKADVGTWQDVSGTVAGTNGNPVKRWDDQSGVGNHLLADPTTTTNQLITANLNGLPTIQPFFGAAQNLQVAIAISPATTLSVYGVFRQTSSAGTTNNNRVVSIQGSGQTNDFSNANSCQFTVASDTTVQLAQNFGNLGSAVAVVSGTWLQAGFVFDGTTATTYKSGTATGAGTADTNALTSPPIICFGAAAANGNGLAGDFAEWIVVNRALTGTELTNLQSYLSTRWGVS